MRWADSATGGVSFIYAAAMKCHTFGAYIPLTLTQTNNIIYSLLFKVNRFFWILDHLDKHVDTSMVNLPNPNPEIKQWRWALRSNLPTERNELLRSFEWIALFSSFVLFRSTKKCRLLKSHNSVTKTRPVNYSTTLTYRARTSNTFWELCRHLNGGLVWRQFWENLGVDFSWDYIPY